MHSLFVRGAAASLLALALAAPAAEAAKRTDVTVMVRNLFIGGDYTAVAAAQPEQFEEEAAKLWQAAERSDIPARMELVADEVRRAKPHVLALQEVALWRKGPKDGKTSPATEVQWDMLALLRAALKERGLKYSVAVKQSDVDVEGSTNLGFDARIGNSNVILVRKGVKARNARTGKFVSQIVFPSPTLGPVTPDRGWGSADITFKRAKFRIVNTHLEAYSPSNRADQARELLAGPLKTSRKKVVAGDLNSAAEQEAPASDAFNAFADAGYAVRRTTKFNCCFNGDDLRTGVWDHNVDWILTKPALKLVRSSIFGNAFKTPSGLYPSDHGGFVSVLRF
jgi:hypothetical protein